MQIKEKKETTSISRDAFLNILEDLYNTKEELTNKNIELRKAKDYVENIVKSIIDALILIDLEGKIQSINPAAVELLGYKEEELINKPVRTIFAGEEIPLEEAKLEKLVMGGELRNYEINYRTKEGKGIPVLFSSSVMKDENGNIICIVCTARDITERKKAEEERALIKGLKEREELLKRQKQGIEDSRRAIKNVAMDLEKSKEKLEKQKKSLEETNKELDDFTYIVSHDLKEPLRSIDAFSKFIVEDYRDKLDVQGREYLERIRANAGRMQALIEDLLEISRLERKKNLFGEVQAKELIAEVKLRLEYAIKQKDAEIIVRDKLPKIFCDRVRLAEVFLNLISNGIKFNDKPQPRIEIGSSQTGTFYEFYVKDNGPGIEEQYFEKIFEIFQRLGRREEYGGTGAGLTIVKKIVQMHKGRIWVESKIGEGTTFYFTVPKEKGVILGKKKIGEILIEKEFVTEDKLKKALEEQQRRC